MPIYEYECGTCKHRFDLKQGFDADPVESCPLCQETSRRVFHSPAIIYKGTGFYTTDYARKNYSPPNEGSEKQEAPSPSKKETDTSSTPKAD